MRHNTPGFLSRRALAWVLAAASLIAVPAIAAEEPVKTAYEWFTLPRTIGSLDYVGEHVYEDQHPGLGRAWNYQRVGLTLTLYVYDEGEPGIPDGIDSARVEAAYEGSKEEILIARRDVNVKLLSEGTIRIGDDNALPAREAVFEVSYKGERGKSYLWLTAVHGQFLKIRFSAVGPGLEEEQLSRGEILQALNVAISRSPISSTGEAAASTGKEVRKREYSMILDIDMPEDEMPFWLTYVAGRAAWRTEHPDTSEPVGVPLKLEFEEAAFALQMALVILDEGDFRVRRRSPVADIRRVSRAGYLREYVWTYLRDDTWQQPAELRLAEFDAWRAKNLKRHKPVIHGSIARSPEEAPAPP